MAKNRGKVSGCGHENQSKVPAFRRIKINND
jgi:hypothetical protein